MNPTHTCPVCDARCKKHCESPTCNWWACTACHSFGDHNGRTVSDDRKRP